MVRSYARPWAFDSAGRPQKTWYEVDQNGDLIQHVEPADNALYPILADPTDTAVAGGTAAAIAAGGDPAVIAVSAAALAATDSGGIEDDQDRAQMQLLDPFGDHGDPGQGPRERPAPGQHTDFGQTAPMLYGGQLDNMLIERRNDDGSVTYLRRDTDQTGTTTERPVDHLEISEEGPVYYFDDGTATNGAGDTVEKIDGVYWVIKPVSDRTTEMTALINGKTVRVTQTRLPNGNLMVTGPGYWRRIYDFDGNLLSEQQLDPGRVVADSSTNRFILSAVLTRGIGPAARGGMALWRLLRKGKEKPSVKTGLRGGRSGRGASERHRSIVEKGAEGGSKGVEVVTRGAGTVRKSGDAFLDIIQKIGGRPAGPLTTGQRVPEAPRVLPGGPPHIEGGSLLVFGAVLLTLLLNWIKGLIPHGGK
ncbi:hypothetical protein MYK68_03660 [Gordonia sp. PP30]|uniref:hypothetical protein n=1 Tax=Gordonia sp. PP30 TaxID=2935861 RepID=UPI001FFF9647|nr:hypothetical protein [Gordonia sp. PP30]UQE75726.1 hypothetical protein MYK68_03660 [Gordonia sp. PP30]